MSVTGCDFLNFANDCMQMDTEIAYRNVIGRSYYGLYHEACSILHNCPSTTHQGVIDYLDNQAWKDNEPYDKHALRSLSIVLQQQHSKRKWADYDLSRTITSSEALESLKVIEKTFIKLNTMVEEAKKTSS